MANGTPKPLALVKGHRTKAEIEVRKKAEAALMTGVEFKASPEVKADKIAYKEFNRLKKLFKSIDKNDGMFESVINRYCMLHSECAALSNKIKLVSEETADLVALKLSGEIDMLEYFDRSNALTAKYLNLDKTLMAKRKQMLDIEKENIMTIQSALRSIPKKPEEAPTPSMASFLANPAGGHGS